jgi:Na+-driven multidrug efflux pump
MMWLLEAGMFNAAEAMAGSLGIVPLTSYAVMHSIHNLTFLSFPVAISIAASIRYKQQGDPPCRSVQPASRMCCYC